MQSDSLSGQAKPVRVTLRLIIPIRQLYCSMYTFICIAFNIIYYFSYLIACILLVVLCIMRLCVYVFMCFEVSALHSFWTYVRVCVYICLYVCMYVCMCFYVFVRAFVRVCENLFIWIAFTFTYHYIHYSFSYWQAYCVTHRGTRSKMTNGRSCKSQ